MRIYKYLILQILLFPFFGIAQFNTLTYTPKHSDETNTHQSDTILIQNNNKKKKHERNISSIFKRATSKKELKKKVDSLTTLINIINQNDSNPNYVTPTRLRKIEDSLFNNIKQKLTEEFTKPTANRHAKQRQIPPNLSVHFSLPLSNELKITSPFSMRKHPVTGALKMHNGVDFRAKYENVHAVLNGKVIQTGFDKKGGGLFIKLSHKGGFETSYLHLHSIYYKVGDYVKAGYTIAKSGNTGNTTGPHLHFAVKENGKFINPITFFKDIINSNKLIQNYYEQSNAFTNR